MCSVFVASFLRSSSPRKLQRLQRQASIYQRPHITKQVTIIGTPPDESLLETDEDSGDAHETNGAESEDEGMNTKRALTGSELIAGHIHN